MGVRKTEYRVPAGFEAAEFGECAEKSGFVLISYLTSPIEINNKIKYLLFVTDPAKRNDCHKYSWNISIGGKKGYLPLIEDSQTDYGIFDYVAQEAGLIKITVKILKNLNPIDEVSLEQRICKENTELEALIEEEPFEPYVTAAIGNERTSRELTNDFHKYIIHVASTKSSNPRKVTNVPLQLLCSIVYLQVLKNPKVSSWEWLPFSQSRWEELKRCEDDLNAADNSPSKGSGNDRLGVCQMDPRVVAVLMNKIAAELLVEEGDLDSEKEKIEAAYKAYVEADENNLLDLYNLLRFPKTNILFAAKLLSYIRNSDVSLKNLSDEALLTNAAAVKKMAAIYNKCIRGEPAPKNLEQDKFAKKVYDILDSPFIAFHYDVPQRINGVIKNADTGQPFPGVRVLLRRKRARIITKNLKGFKEPKANAADLEEVTRFPSGSLVNVIEFIPNFNGQNLDWARLETGRLRAWINSRAGDDHYASITRRIEQEIDFGVTDEDGLFDATILGRPALSKLICYSELDQGDYDNYVGYLHAGYTGWSIPPNEDLVINMRKGEIEEDYIFQRVADYAGWTYKWKPIYYPWNVPDVHGLNVTDGSAATRVTNCCTFAEGIIIKAAKDTCGEQFFWARPVIGHFTWHEITMPIAEYVLSTNRMKILDPTIEAGLGVMYQINESDGSTYQQNLTPVPWLLVQGYTKAHNDPDFTVGHRFIIVDYHEPTKKVLILEANIPKAPHPTDSGGRNGPQYRGLGHIDKFAVNDYRPPEDWYTNDAVPTWQQVCNDYPWRVMVKLNVR